MRCFPAAGENSYIFFYFFGFFVLFFPFTSWALQTNIYVFYLFLTPYFLSASHNGKKKENKKAGGLWKEKKTHNTFDNWRKTSIFFLFSTDLFLYTDHNGKKKTRRTGKENTHNIFLQMKKTCVPSFHIFFSFSSSFSGILINSSCLKFFSSLWGGMGKFDHVIVSVPGRWNSVWYMMSVCGGGRGGRGGITGKIVCNFNNAVFSE